MTVKKLLLCAGVLGLLGGCAASTSPPPGGYGVCAESPGSYACQVDRYNRAG